MAIKITGMEMPKSCRECILPHSEAIYRKNGWAEAFHLCPLVAEYVDIRTRTRHPKCPLQEVKE